MNNCIFLLVKLWSFLLLKVSSHPALSHQLSSADEINQEGFSCQLNTGRKLWACVFKPGARQLLTDGEVNKQAVGRRAGETATFRMINVWMSLPEKEETECSWTHETLFFPLAEIFYLTLAVWEEKVRADSSDGSTFPQLKLSGLWFQQMVNCAKS